MGLDLLTPDAGTFLYAYISNINQEHSRNLLNAALQISMRIGTWFVVACVGAVVLCIRPIVASPPIEFNGDLVTTIRFFVLAGCLSLTGTWLSSIQLSLHSRRFQKAQEQSVIISKQYETLSSLDGSNSNHAIEIFEAIKHNTGIYETNARLKAHDWAIHATIFVLYLLAIICLIFGVEILV